MGFHALIESMRTSGARAISPEREARIVELLKGDMTLAVIAERLGVSVPAVAKVNRKFGIRIKHGRV